MAKGRRERRKAKKEKSKKVKKKITRELIKREEIAMRDQYLFGSSWKAFLLATICLILAIWMCGDIPPFDKIQEYNPKNFDIDMNIVDQMLNTIPALLFFFFAMVGWGNALEIHGDVLEWKHAIIVLLITMFVAGWGGEWAFGMTLLGSFAILIAMWYTNR
ncbi:MAG: hypothetical protein ACTSWN_01965 [Promethearchaeota archaeon]